jgi:glycosyltransferase involved in cell wall biosynthesis
MGASQTTQAIGDDETEHVDSHSRGRQSPRVSVVMSVYNHERYVREAITSVLSQTYGNFDLIVLDNGSTDRSREIIAGFQDPRVVTLFEPQNLTAYFGIHRCIDASTGEYVAFIGSDDVWESTKLEKQVAFTLSHPHYGMVFTESDIIDSDGNRRNWTPFLSAKRNMSRVQWLRHFFFFSNCVCWSSCLMARHLIRPASYADARFRQLGDLYGWITALTQSELYIYPETLTHFRQHGENESSKDIHRVHMRADIESIYIFELYKSFNVDDLKEIFPELKTVENMTNDNKDYYIARLAIDKLHESMNAASRRLFGIQTIFSFYSSEQRAVELRNQDQFTLEDFYRTTGLGIDLSYYDWTKSVLTARQIQRLIKVRQNWRISEWFGINRAVMSVYWRRYVKKSLRVWRKC